MTEVVTDDERASREARLEAPVTAADPGRVNANITWRRPTAFSKHKQNCLRLHRI